MLLSFFKGNQPFSLFVALPVITLAFWASGVINAEPMSPEHTMPLFGAVSGVLKIFPLLAIVVSMILVYIQAGLINSYINNYEVLPLRSNLTGLFYVLLMSSFKFHLVLHPVIFSNLFLILAFRKICSIYRQDYVFSHAFDAGVLLSIASLFYYPSLIFFPVIWIALMVIRPFIWREYVISTAGLLVPYLFAATYYILTDRVDYFLTKILIVPDVNLNGLLENITTAKVLYTSWGILVLASLPSYVSVTSQSVVRTQNLLKVIGGYLMLAVSGFVLLSNSSSYTFTMLALPLSVFVSNYFLNMRWKWMAEVIFTVLLGIIIYQHISN